MPVNGPPRVLVDAERLLVLHDGRLLIRLDPVNGSKRWSAVLGIEDLSERPEAIACDDRRVYCASQQTLRALSIDDGKAALDVPLDRARKRRLVAGPFRAVRRGLSQRLEPLGRRAGEHAGGGTAAGYRGARAAIRLPRDDRGSQREAGARGLVATSRALWGLCRRDAACPARPASSLKAAQPSTTAGIETPQQSVTLSVDPRRFAPCWTTAAARPRFSEVPA